MGGQVYRSSKGIPCCPSTPDSWTKIDVAVRKGRVSELGVHSRDPLETQFCRYFYLCYLLKNKWIRDGSGLQRFFPFLTFTSVETCLLETHVVLTVNGVFV